MTFNFEISTVTMAILRKLEMNMFYKLYVQRSSMYFKGYHNFLISGSGSQPVARDHVGKPLSPQNIYLSPQNIRIHNSAKLQL